jgi:hypothetical protein
VNCFWNMMKTLAGPSSAELSIPGAPNRLPRILHPICALCPVGDTNRCPRLARSPIATVNDVRFGRLRRGSYEVTSLNRHHQNHSRRSEECQQAHSQLIHRAQPSQKHAAYQGPLHNKNEMTHRSASYQILVRKTRHDECGTDAAIITLGSNYIMRTHKHRSTNKRELPFRCNHWRRITLTHC